MHLLTATELSAHLGVSKARVSQYVSEGKLVGCFKGDGRARRFDLAKCAEALGKRLDKSQMLGNGAQTRVALATIGGDTTPAGDEGPAPARRQKTDGRLTSGDQDEYTLTTLAIRQEELRKKRRENALDEGRFILASEAEREITRLIGQEVSGFETVIRDGARAIADQLGVDFKSARKILIDIWRAHRGTRAGELSVHSGAATLSEAEKDADI